MNKMYSVFVWVFSSAALMIYVALFNYNQSVPGAEKLISFITSIDGVYVFLAAFILILIEGLYIIGIFFLERLLY